MFWYGWAFSDSSVTHTFQEKQQCFRQISPAGHLLLFGVASSSALCTNPPQLEPNRKQLNLFLTGVWGGSYSLRDTRGEGLLVFLLSFIRWKVNLNPPEGVDALCRRKCAWNALPPPKFLALRAMRIHTEFYSTCGEFLLPSYDAWKLVYAVP